MVASWVFVDFCHGNVHSSAAFCGTIFVPLHCFMCHGVTLYVVALCFVLLCSFLCHGAVFVPQLVGVVAFMLCAIAWHNMLWHCAMCFFCAAPLCVMPWQLFCAMLLHNVLWHCMMCHGIVQYAAALFLCHGIVLHAMAMLLCHGIVQCAAALCGMLQHCMVC